MRTTVVLDDALFQAATKAVLEEWLAKNEPPPQRWKTIVIEAGLNALLADENLSRTLRDAPVARPKNLTIIVDEGLLGRAGEAVLQQLGPEREKMRMAGAVINHGLRALLRRRASKRLAKSAGVEVQPARSTQRGRAS